MKNFVKSGQSLTYTAGADISSGTLVVAGSIGGVAITDIANGAAGEIQIAGVVTLPKATAAGAIAIGEPCYADGAEITDDDTGNTQVGFAAAPAAADATSIQVLLNGNSAATAGH